MKNTPQINTNKGWLGLIFGSLLVGIPAIPAASEAPPIAQANPCPGIFYETPYNRGLYRQFPNCPAASPEQPPLPELQQAASAMVAPVNGKVNVTLTNQTNAQISYQVIGDTQERWISGNSEEMLQGLETPVTITFGRPDGGLLMVQPQASEPGMLKVTLMESSDLGLDQNALRIQETGAVYLN